MSIADSLDALADLEQQMSTPSSGSYSSWRCTGSRARVKPTTWEAFRLTSIENLPAVEAAERARHAGLERLRRQAPRAEIARARGKDAENAMVLRAGEPHEFTSDTEN